MPRYIDADAYEFPGDLLHVPTADVVEVVRCKYCSKSKETEDEEYRFCMQFADTVHSQAFCSYGKRKEGD